ncbi:MAG: hypothetical protein ACRDF4_05555, partial [Rhabdochlamydiaceae bacterium]
MLKLSDFTVNHMNKIAPARGNLVWFGRPAIGAYLALYGIVAIIAIVILDTLEWYYGNTTSWGSMIFPRTFAFGSTVIPYPVEIVTTLVILFIYISKVINYALLKARSKYELYVDGLYLNLGLVNLESTYIAPMAFSDARLIRTLPLRLINRGLIIIDTNDSRHFYLHLI